VNKHENKMKERCLGFARMLRSSMTYLRDQRAVEFVELDPMAASYGLWCSWPQARAYNAKIHVEKESSRMRFA
jgi:hypothetical protein